MTELSPEEREDPMARVFPKMTKCTFHKFGPSGTVEKFDGLCVLPLNIINEKIYVFLWFWFIILTVVTGMQVIYRYVPCHLYHYFNLYVCLPVTLHKFVPSV